MAGGYWRLLTKGRGKAVGAVREARPAGWDVLGPFGAFYWDRRLAGQLSPGHVLRNFGHASLAKAARTDDLAVLCADGRVGVVHLTFARETLPQWPSCHFHDSVADWLHALVEPEPGGEEALDCPICHARWDQGEFELEADCPCCGGGALERECPQCGGRCGARWQRAVLDSWDSGQAHWVGRCKL